MQREAIGQTIRDHLRESQQTKQAILDDADLVKVIEDVAVKCVEAYKAGGKILIAGNGGSAADAQHIAGELVSRFYFDRPGLPAIALTTDTSILTAIGNDYGMNRTFARQVEANGRAGDVFLGISTSGNSENVVEALKAAKSMEIATVGLTGAGGGTMAELCDYCIRVPATDTPRIQESHITIGHIVCAIIEESLFEKP